MGRRSEARLRQLTLSFHPRHKAGTENAELVDAVVDAWFRLLKAMRAVQPDLNRIRNSTAPEYSPSTRPTRRRLYGDAWAENPEAARCGRHPRYSNVRARPGLKKRGKIRR